MESKKFLTFVAIFFAMTTALLIGILIGKSEDKQEVFSMQPNCEPVITWALAEFPTFRDEFGNCIPTQSYADEQLKATEASGNIGNKFVCSLMYFGNSEHESACIRYRKTKYPRNPD